MSNAPVPTPLPLRTGFDLTRESPFTYECRGCAKCCYGKAIPVNPYEVARIAGVLALSTTDVLERFTQAGGAYLRTEADRACVFLREGRCSVHAGRPLACRLYPLGRQLKGREERFAEVVPHPESTGLYGKEGTVRDWLSAQGVDAYIAANDRYVALLGRLLEAVARCGDLPGVSEEASLALSRAPVPSDESLLDMDAVVARWCAERGLPVPTDVGRRTEIHLEAVESIIARMG